MADVKAKVADYPFTTLVPNLASVSVGDFRFNVIDIPGLIEGASDGKGLGNAFLRHVLKSRVFAFVADLSRFESGIEETVQLIEEIMIYLTKKFSEEEGDLSFVFREENGLISFEVAKDDEVILTKKILFIFNKWDLINDEEILAEYKKVFFDQVNEFLSSKSLPRLDIQLLEKNIFLTSAGTYYGVGELLRKFAELINELESRFSKVRYIQNREITKMVFTIPRGNDEAESYFRAQMQSRGFIQLLEDEGMMRGDVLRIKSYYEGIDDKYILY